MEPGAGSLFLRLLLLFLPCLTLSFFAIKILRSLWWSPKKLQQHFSKQGVTGPPYQFFLGNLKELSALMSEASSQPLPLLSHNILPRVLPFLHHWNKIYGATFLVWFGSTARLIVSDPELIREIFTSKSESYEKTNTHPLVKQLEGDGLLSHQGQKWSHHRKMLNPTFHTENLKLLIPAMAESVTEMLDIWSGSDEVEIEVSNWFQTLTAEAITRTVFGNSYKDGKAIFQLQAEQMSYAAESFQKVFIPGYRFIPTRKNRKSWKLDKEIRKLLVKLIDRRRENLGEEIRANLNGAKDLLGMMIRASQKEMSHEENQSLSSSSSSSSAITYSDIIEECKTFFFAGKQTTSNLLTWTTILLAMHPHWQTLAREELLQVCGSVRPPSKDDLPKLKLLSMIVNESLRLYPPTVAMIRRAKADVELGTYNVPSGTELLIPILAVQHDKASWGIDAHEFNPARFTSGVSKAAKHPMAFIPFGAGARSCIGQDLATLQAKIAMAVILQKCNLRLAPSYQHAPTVLLMLYPQHGAPVIFQRLRSNNDHNLSHSN